MSDGEAGALDRLEITQASSVEQIACVQELFLEYAQSLSFSLCFQTLESEVAQLPTDYRPVEDRQCASRMRGLHKPDSGIEINRLYLRPRFRGRTLGKLLAQTVIAETRQIGYQKLRRNTVESMMPAAVALYRGLGFEEMAPTA